MATSKKDPLHIVLWILQVALGVMMLMSGANKLFTEESKLVAMGMSFITEYGIGFARFLGVCLVAGGLGLILPAATRILPWLTPLAALLLTIYFALATAQHLTHAESAGLTIGFTLLFAFIAWGRFKARPIAAKA